MPITVEFIFELTGINAKVAFESYFTIAMKLQKIMAAVYHVPHQVSLASR